MSQTDVARKLDLSFQQIQKYEIGANRIAASRLFDLAGVLDVPPAYFFDGLHANGENGQRADQELEIMGAIASIKDRAIKARIITFIEDVSGLTVARSR